MRQQVFDLLTRNMSQSPLSARSADAVVPNCLSSFMFCV